jgi:hypothetical protein
MNDHDKIANLEAWLTRLEKSLNQIIAKQSLSRHPYHVIVHSSVPLVVEADSIGEALATARNIVFNSMNSEMAGYTARVELVNEVK